MFTVVDAMLEKINVEYLVTEKKIVLFVRYFYACHCPEEASSQLIFHLVAFTCVTLGGHRVTALRSLRRSP